MKERLYVGMLDFVNDSDEITVKRLVLRENDIAFEFVASWGDAGRWLIDTVAVPCHQGYVSAPKRSKREGDPQDMGVICTIELIILKSTAKEIEIKGTWCELNERHPFKGTLQRSRANSH